MAADLESLFKQARQLFRQGKHALSIQFFQQALEVDPDEADVHDAIATAYFHVKEYDKAVGHFTRVTQLRPKDAKAYINLGAVYNRKEDFAKAAEMLKKAISRDGHSVEAYYNLGIAYRGLKQPAMAINSYKEALKINPRMLDALQNLGNTYLEMNNVKAAIEQYHKALEIEPEFARAQRGLARAEEAQNKARGEFNPFGRLVDQNPNQQAKAEIRVKKMTSEERVADRQFLRRTMIETQSICTQMFEHLRDRLGEDLPQLNRGVQMSRQEVHRSIFEARDNFETAFQKFQSFHSELLRLTKELQAHEADLKAK